MRDSIQATLEDRIRHGHYAAGRRLPAERALSEDLGVSRAVVRAAVAGLESAGFLVRSPGCRPVVKTQASNRRVGTSSTRHTLALWLMHRPTDGEAPALLYGIQNALDPDSHRLIVANAMGETWDAVVQSEAQFLSRMTEDRDIAGVLMWYVGGQDNLPALERLRSVGVPLVFIDRLPPNGFEADHVGVANRYAAEEAVNHLIALGHTRIAHVTNYDGASPVAERLAGYRLALGSAGIPFDESLVIKGRLPGASPKDRLAIVDKLLNRPSPPTALFALNDRIAFELLDAFKTRGTCIPEEMAVVGFDGVERWMPGPAFLTTCNQPFQRVAAHAVELLLWRIEQGPDAPYRHVLLEAPLAAYGSSDPAQSA